MKLEAPIAGFIGLLVLGLALILSSVANDAPGPEILGTAERSLPATSARNLERRSHSRTSPTDLPVAAGPMLTVQPSDRVVTASLRGRIFAARSLPKELRTLVETAAAFLSVEASASFLEVGDEIPQVRPGTLFLGDSHEQRFAVVTCPEAWAIVRVEPWESEVSCRLFRRQQIDLRLRSGSAASRLSGSVRLVDGEIDLEIADIADLQAGRTLWNPQQAIQFFGSPIDRHETMRVLFDRLASAPIDIRSPRQSLTLDVEGLTTIVLAVEHDDLGAWKPAWEFSLAGTSKVGGAAAFRKAMTATDDRVAFVVGTEEFPLEAVVRLDVDGAPFASVVIAEPPREPVTWLRYSLPGSILTGRLVDEAQTALSERTALARVVDGRSTVEERRISTDEAGRFVAYFDQVTTAPHSRTFTAVAAGSANAEIRGETNLPATIDASFDLGTITLKQGAILVAGCVSDGASRPLSGVQIDVWFKEVAVGTAFGHRTAVKVVTSDEDGLFVATAHAVFPGSEVTLIAKVADYRQATAQTVAVGCRDAHLTLDQAAKLVGRVTVDRPDVLRSLELRITGEPAHSTTFTRSGVSQLTECAVKPAVDGDFEFGSLGSGRQLFASGPIPC